MAWISIPVCRSYLGADGRSPANLDRDSISQWRESNRHRNTQDRRVCKSDPGRAAKADTAPRVVLTTSGPTTHRHARGMVSVALHLRASGVWPNRSAGRQCTYSAVSDGELLRPGCAGTTNSHRTA